MRKEGMASDQGAENQKMTWRVLQEGEERTSR